MITGVLLSEGLVVFCVGHVGGGVYFRDLRHCQVDIEEGIQHEQSAISFAQHRI